MRRILAAVALSLVGGAALRADTDKPLRSWVNQLGAEQYPAREAAARHLRQLGPDALPLLQPFRDHRDPEVRRRLADVLAHLQVQADAREVLVARTARVAVTDAGALDALAALAKEGGGEFRYRGDEAALAKRRVTLDTGPVPFWDAFDRLCDEAKLRLADPDAEPANPVRRYSRGGASRYQLDRDVLERLSSVSPVEVADGREGLPRTTVGPLRVRVLTERSAAEGGVHDPRVAFVLEVRPEPWLVWDELAALRIDRAVTNRGGAWEPCEGFAGEPAWLPDAEPGATVYYYGGSIPAGLGTRQARVALRRGDARVTHLRELGGTLAAWVRTPPEELVRVADVGKAKGQAVPGRGDSGVRVVEWTSPEEGFFNLKVETTAPCRVPRIPQLAPLSVNLMKRWRGFAPLEAPPDPCEIRLVDARGVPLKILSATTAPAEIASPVRTTVLELAAPRDVAPPIRLVLEGPRVCYVEARFTLRDVPVPPAP